MNYFGEAYVKLLSRTVEYIKRMDAEKRTTAAFGKRWIRNFFRNIRNVKETVLYKTADIPVIVTGSGPSLETALPAIRKIQERCLILAASSSVMALTHGGVSPDIVIATDGGSWALRHIYPCYRTNARTLAANLCAAIPSQFSSTPHLIINDGSLWQSIILHELSLPSVIIPQRGTVTASAVELAMILTRGNIYLAGMDLAVRDIKTHARPYAFDNLFYSRSCRFTPFYSESFIRSGLIHGGGSMAVYASWFKNRLASWPKRVFSIGGSHEVFEDSIISAPTASKKTGDYFSSVPAKEDFCKRGASALLDAMNNPQYTETLTSELTPLLFPDEKKATEKMLQAAITEIACRYEKG
jgi:hypothetical protein